MAAICSVFIFILTDYMYACLSLNTVSFKILFTKISELHFKWLTFPCICLPPYMKLDFSLYS